MYFNSLALLLVALTASQLPSVFAGQVPSIDGIIGGVPNTLDRLQRSSVKPGTGVQTVGALRVTENSGICETTLGVYQASGYADIAGNKSLWFWFFEARKDPHNAPLSIWLNGGPGSSSMIGLFQEHGPCRINNDSLTVSYNPNSWNNVSNMIYLDQPVGVGFSYGTLDVGTSEEAVADIWTFLQIFFSDPRYKQYVHNDFAIWTESYGGHYGPALALHILDQNEAIANRSITGLPINLKFLGVGDGLTDALSQYPGYISYATDNGYHPLVNAETLQSGNGSYYESGGCQDQIIACYDGGNNTVCSNTQSFCNVHILDPLSGDWDVYYILTANPDPYPPELGNYLGNTTLLSIIGAEANWSETNYNVYFNFADTGDWMRNFRPYFERVINVPGLRTIFYDGDADYILNHDGVEAMLNNFETIYSSEYRSKSFSNWSVAGTPAGIYKNAGMFSYVRIFGAGHEVAAYKHLNLTTGQAALEMFSQIMSNHKLRST